MTDLPAGVHLISQSWVPEQGSVVALTALDRSELVVGGLTQPWLVELEVMVPLAARAAWSAWLGEFGGRAGSKVFSPAAWSASEPRAPTAAAEDVIMDGSGDAVIMDDGGTAVILAGAAGASVTIAGELGQNTITLSHPGQAANWAAGMMFGIRGRAYRTLTVSVTNNEIALTVEPVFSEDIPVGTVVDAAPQATLGLLADDSGRIPSGAASSEVVRLQLREKLRDAAAADTIYADALMDWQVGSGLTLSNEAVTGWTAASQVALQLGLQAGASVEADHPQFSASAVVFQDADYLTADLPAALDFYTGVSVFAVARLTAIASGTTGRLLSLHNSGGTAIYEAILGAGDVRLQGTGITADIATLTDDDVTAYAVWGFIWDVARQRVRVTRNGVVVSDGAVAAPPIITGAAEVRIGDGGAAHLRAVLAYAGIGDESAVIDQLAADYSVTL